MHFSYVDEVKDFFIVTKFKDKPPNVSKIVQEFSEIDYITNGREKWDDFDNHNDYFGLLPMWNSCPKSFKSFNSYHFLTSQQYLYDDDLIGEYKHPTEKGHELIAKKILELF